VKNPRGLEGRGGRVRSGALLRASLGRLGVVRATDGPAATDLDEDLAGVALAFLVVSAVSRRARSDNGRLRPRMRLCVCHVSASRKMCPKLLRPMCKNRVSGAMS
jgi:hypothetical protein